jgi:hypothetical protein
VAEVIRFTSQAVMRVNRQVVYWKRRWADEWERRPELWCRDAVWSMAPSLSTAQIILRYGDTLEIGAREFTQRYSVDAARFYVRIDYLDFPLRNDDEESTTFRQWYGVIDAIIDEQHGPKLEADNGVVTGYPRGRDHYLAFGMESLLTQAWIDYSTVAGEEDDVTYVGRALAFNPGLAVYNPDPAETTGEGNRSEELGPSGNSYVFHNRRTGGKKWSTRTAVEYELNYLPIRDADDDQQIPFYLDDPGTGVLPDWDEPVLPREGRTTWDILNRLIPRQRAMTWRTQVVTEGDGVSQHVEITPYSMLSENLELENGHELPANENQVTLAFEKDRGADVEIRQVASETVDQIIVRGERRTGTGTFSYPDQTLDKGWPTALETGFEKGASEAGDYPASTEIDERADRNWFCRQADKFLPVFARHVLTDGYDGMVGDGVGGDKVPLVPDDEDSTKPLPLAPDDQRFLPRLALLEGYEYDGDAIDSGNPTEFGSKPERHMKPLVLFPRTNLDDDDETERYRHAEKGPPPFSQGDDAEPDRGWTAHVRIDDDDGALWVVMASGAQCLMAKTDFTRLENAGEPADEDFVGDYRDMLATLTVACSSFAEAKYPEEPEQDADFVRRKIILAPFHRLDYVAPQTVVGIDEKTGELLRTDTGGFVRDDRDKLKDIAKLAWAWYGSIRKAIRFETSLVNNLLELGDLVVGVGDPEIAGNGQIGNINSIVTLIRISSPLGEDAEPPPPTIGYQTEFGELDVLQLVPRVHQR